MTANPSQRERYSASFRIFWLVSAACTVAGCAHVPDVTIAYRPVTWSVGVSVVHTLVCNREGTQVMVARGATFTPLYFADRDAEPQPLSLKDLNSPFADSELTVGFTDDGRLRTVNQSTTGQGEAIAKALVVSIGAIGASGAIAGAAGAAMAVAPLAVTPGWRPPSPAEEPRTGPQAICNIVKKWSNADLSKGGLPQVSLVQSVGIKPEHLPKKRVTVANADDQTKALIQDLSKAGLDTSTEVALSLAPPGKSGAQPVGHVNFKGEMRLKIQQTGALTLLVELSAADVEENKRRIASSTVTIPLPLSDSPASYVDLPIPKPVLFGKQNFQLVLGESGRISTLGYSKTAGAASAINAASSIAGEQTQSDAAEAAALKAAADLIAQQNRYSDCVRNRNDCK